MAKGYEEAEAKQEEEKKIGQEVAEKDNKPQEQEESSLPPLDILVSANVKDMDVPYFMGKNINFKMDMKKVTSDMNNVVGILSLTTDNGTIKDIYKLTEANTVVKVMFMSLKIVSDVINALNVLEILGNIGSALLSSDKEEDNITEVETIEPFGITLLGADVDPAIPNALPTADVSQFSMYDVLFINELFSFS